MVPPNTVCRNTICPWYDGTALEAATNHPEPFPDSAGGDLSGPRRPTVGSAG
jgi:predicted 3-demethylubiquinone-9 3-methyltransferase (glyoxalase superfamily)